MTPRSLVPLLSLFVAVGAAGAAAPPRPPFPVVARAAAAPEWEANFAGQSGWIGGDGAYSVVLGPRRVLWLFGDTLIGTVKDGKRTGAKMVNNTLAVQAGRDADAIRFVRGGTKDKPAAFFVPAEDKGWFWPMAAVRSGDRLFAFLAQIDKGSGKGAFGFKHVGMWLAVVENPDDDPAKWRMKQKKLPFATFDGKRERSWGAAVLAVGDHLYVYGYDEERGKGIGKRRLTVARVPSGKLDDFTAWRYRTEKGWSDKASDAAPLAAGLATEFSVTPLPNGSGYAVVYTENGIGGRIVARFAPSPDGPFADPVLLYKCPEALDKGVFCYSAKAHAWAAKGNELLVTYCVNAWDFGRLFRDEKVYRPKVVRVTLKAGQ